MLRLDEALARLASNTLRGRVRRDQLRVRRLNLFELLHEQIKFSVADFRIVEDVIAVLVMANLIAQRFDVCRVFGLGGHTCFYFLRYSCGIGLSGVSACHMIVMIHQRLPSFTN